MNLQCSLRTRRLKISDDDVKSDIYDFFYQ